MEERRRHDESLLHSVGEALDQIGPKLSQFDELQELVESTLDVAPFIP